MANAYGIVHQYGEPQSTFDSELAISVLQQKQGQFDANQQKIDQTLSQMGLQASMIKNDDARQYLNDRVNKVIQETQSLRTSDIGSRDSTRKIISTISSALDDKAIKHIGYGQQIDNFNRSVQAVMEDEDGNFSQDNYQDAIKSAGLEEYLNGDADSDLGALSYSSYTDYKAELVATVKGLKEIQGSRVVDIEDPNIPGKITKVTIDNLTAGQWIDVLPQRITPQMETQMEIDGRAMFQWDKTNLIRYKSEAISAEKEVIQKKIDGLKSKLKTGQPDKATTAKHKKDIEAFEKSIAKLSQQEMNQDYDMTATGKAIVMSRAIQSIASIAGSDPSEEISFDEDLADRTTRALYDQEMPGVNVLDMTARNIKEIKAEDFLRAATEIENTYNSTLNSGMSTLPEELRKDTEALAKGYMEEGLSKTEARFKAFEVNALKSGSLESLNYLHETRKARSDHKMQSRVDKKGYEEGTKNLWSTENSTIYKSVTEKGFFDDTKIVLEDGTAMHSKDYLEKEVGSEQGFPNGITNKEDFQKFTASEEGADFRGQLLADVALSETNTSLDGRVTSIGGALKGSGVVGRFSKEDLHNLKTLSSNFGEDLKMTDLFIFSVSDTSIFNPPANNNSIMDIFTLGSNDSQPVEDNYREVDENYVLEHLGDAVENYKIELNPDAKGTESYKAIQKRLGVNDYSGGRPGDRSNSETSANPLKTFTDNSFYDDFSIKNIFSRKNVISEVNRAREKENVKVNQPKKIVLDPPLKPSEPGPQWIAAKRLIGSGDAEGLIDLNNKGTLEIFRDPTDPNMYVIRQLNVERKANYDKKKIESLSAFDEVRVDATQFRQALPVLASRIDDLEVAGQLNFNSNFEDTQPSLSYPKGEDVEIVKSYTEFFNFNPNLAGIATEDGAHGVIKNSLPEDQAKFYMENVFEKVFENSNKFSVKYKKKGNEQYAKIYFKNKENEEQVGSLDLSGMDQEQISKTFNVAPQVFLSQYLQIMASDLKKDDGFPGRRLIDFMKILDQL